MIAVQHVGRAVDVVIVVNGAIDASAVGIFSVVMAVFLIAAVVAAKIYHFYV